MPSLSVLMGGYAPSVTANAGLASVTFSAPNVTATVSTGALRPATSTLQYIAPTLPSLPAARTLTADPTWGTHYQYIGSGHFYSNNCPWSATEQYYWDHYSHTLLNGKTYASLGARGYPTEPHWAYLPAHEAWMFGMGPSPSFQNFGYWNMVTNAWVTLRSFPGYSNLLMGDQEGNFSWDDNIFIFHATRNSDSAQVIIRYNLTTDATTVRAISWPNNSKISYDGNQVLLNYENAGGAVLLDSNLTTMRTLTAYSGHSDVGKDKDGHPIFVVCQNTPGLDNIYSYRMDQATSLHDVGALLPSSIGLTFQQGYASMQATQLPGWVVLGGYRYSVTSSPGYGQVVAVPTDGTASGAGAGVMVFGFSRSQFSSPSDGAAYDRLIAACPNRSLTQIATRVKWNLDSSSSSGGQYGIIHSA